MTPSPPLQRQALQAFKPPFTAPWLEPPPWSALETSKDTEHAARHAQSQSPRQPRRCLSRTSAIVLKCRPKCAHAVVVQREALLSLLSNTPFLRRLLSNCRPSFFNNRSPSFSNCSPSLRQASLSTPTIRFWPARCESIRVSIAVRHNEPLQEGVSNAPLRLKAPAGLPWPVTLLTLGRRGHEHERQPLGLQRFFGCDAETMPPCLAARAAAYLGHAIIPYPHAC